MEIDGEYTTATIQLDEAHVEDRVVEQVQAHVDSPAFTRPVVLMPDTHPGQGVPIGFTMPLDRDHPRVVPTTVGVDIGCGMTAVNVGDALDGVDLAALDDAIHAEIPLGTGETHSDPDYHLGDDFPWGACERKLASLADALGGLDVDGDYGLDYFKETMRRVGYGMNTAICSMGTLGGGNHFVEVSRSERTGDHWVVVHSGSRGPGAAIARHWQDRAATLQRTDYVAERYPEAYAEYLRFDRDDPDAVDWVLGGKGEHPLDRERVRAELSGSEIEAAFDAVAAMRPPEDGGGDDLAHLAGEQTHGYFRDMVFAQTYAEENRRRLVEQVLALAGVDGAAVEERIVSTHNYVDFDDLVVRKGATRAREGERLVVPFNMAEGTVVCEGLGNDDWNHSAPHGAGRRGSRRWAHEELDHEAAVAELAARGIHATNVPADEIPAAYKDPDLVAEAMTDSVRVVDELTPLLNAKGQ